MAASKLNKNSGRKPKTIKSGKKSSRPKKQDKPLSKHIESHQLDEASRAIKKPSTNEVAYLQALVALAGTVLTILSTFLLAYSIYARQNKDKLAIGIQEDLHDLNKSIDSLSSTGSVRGMFIGNYMNMIQRESWDESPRGIFAEDVNDIQQKFAKAKKISGGDFKTPVSLLEVRHSFNDLFDKMYCELPSYRAVNRKERMIEFYDEFIDVNFPTCRSQFESWSKKYLLYHGEVRKIFSNLREIILSILLTERASYVSLYGKLVAKQHTGISESRLFDLLLDQRKNAERYADFIRNLNIIRTKVVQINQNIRYHKNFGRFSPSSLTCLFLILAVVSGILLPLLRLAWDRFNVFGIWINAHVCAVTGWIFFLCILVAIIFLVKDLSTSVTT